MTADSIEMDVDKCDIRLYALQFRKEYSYITMAIIQKLEMRMEFMQTYDCTLLI